MTTSTLSEVLKQAIDYIENVPDDRDSVGHIDRDALVVALNQSIKELKSQEPVAHWSDCAVHSEPAYPKCECNCGGFNPLAWLVEDVDGSHLYWTYKQPIGKEKWTPLFSSPSQRIEQGDKHD